MDFISFTGALICGKNPALPSSAELAGLCSQAQQNGMGAIYYYFLKDQLPSPYQEIFRNAWQGDCVYMMKQEMGFRTVCRKLEAKNIRFAPFKGADLAFNVYPDPALRTFGDWDLLFHPEDCDKAHELLNQDGWTPEYVYDGKHYGHHYHARSKGEFHLEPHWTLPSFGGIAPSDIWQYINPVAENRSMHKLSPELNIIMQQRHSASQSYTHLHWIRLFTDLSFSIRLSPPDIELLCGMAKRWNFPNPRNFLGAFPEFFNEPLSCDTEKSKMWRNIFLSQKEFDNANDAEWEMNSPEAYSFSWIRKNIVSFWKRTLSTREQTGKNIFAVLYAEVKLKVTGLFRFTLQRNPKIRQRYKKVAEAESDI